MKQHPSIEQSQQIEALYSEYTEKMGTPLITCTLEHAKTLNNLLRSFHPKRIMDAGCGFSTVVILKYLFEMYQFTTKVIIVDSYIEYADTVLRFCQSKGWDVNDKKVYFRNIPWKMPLTPNLCDFMNYDYRLGVFKTGAFKSFYDTVSPGGIIFVPNMESETYRTHITVTTEDQDLYISYKEATKNRQGLYSGMIMKR